jgi:hypothetical protein
MDLYFVRHDNSARSFLFQGTEDFAVGDAVICSTRYGDAKGTVVAKIAVEFEIATVVADACGAYWPLAMIIGKYVKPIVTSIDEVPPEIIEQIRQQELKKIINKLQSERPEVPFEA